MVFIESFKDFPFTHEGTTYQVYCKKGDIPAGNREPAILLMHELPGITLQNNYY